MNKKELIHLRMLAKEMPDVYEKFPNADLVRGSVVIAAGTRYIDGKLVDPDKHYINQRQFKKINHYKKLKKFYKKYQGSFLIHYNKWLNNHIAMMEKNHPELFKDTTEEHA